MPQRRRAEPEAAHQVQLTISREDAAERIEDRIVKGTELSSSPMNTVDIIAQAETEYKIWDDYNRELFARIFDDFNFSLDDCAKWQIYGRRLHWMIPSARKTDVNLIACETAVRAKSPPENPSGDQNKVGGRSRAFLVGG